ncbi:MAG: flavodoxin family protein [Armatimonadota bacterium]
MNILGIMGSPRKRGNTHVMLERVLDAARACGAETEIVFLGDLEIQECTGCHACWKPGACVKLDDMPALYAKIAACDALVFGTPVYWYAPTALMKAFLDRFVYFNCPEHREHIRGKSAALLVPFEDDDLATAAMTIAIFGKSLEWLEMPLPGLILAPGVTERGEVAQKADVMAQAEALGRKLAGA